MRLVSLPTFHGGRPTFCAIMAICLCLLSISRTSNAQQVHVTDQRGKVVTLSAPARRIVTIPMPMASVVMALDGSSERIVAMHPASRKSIEQGFLKKVFPDALALRTDVVRGGMFTPNLETILELRPDVVIQWTLPQDIIKTLEDAGVTVVGLINSPPTQEVNEANMTIVAEVIGRKDRVDRLKRENKVVLDAVQAGTASLSETQRVKAVYLRSVLQKMEPAGNTSYQDYWITVSGGMNVAGGERDGNSMGVSVEQLVAWNPSVIFIGNFDDAVPADIVNNPMLAGVDAVRNRRVYKVPHGGYRWDPGSHESRLQWQWASMLLHPETFSFDLRGDMKNLYKFLYNYELGEPEIDQILQMKDNESMAGYERFKPR